MGTPQPPNKPGDACPLCFGPGTTFGDFETPYWISVDFDDLEPGEFWIPGDEQLLLSHHLIPQKGVVCQWELAFGDYIIFLSWNVLGTLLTLANTLTGKLVFNVESDDLCSTELLSDLLSADGFQAYGGTANITWNQGEVG